MDVTKTDRSGGEGTSYDGELYEVFDSPPAVPRSLQAQAVRAYVEHERGQCRYVARTSRRLRRLVALGLRSRRVQHVGKRVER